MKILHFDMQLYRIGGIMLSNLNDIGKKETMRQICVVYPGFIELDKGL